MRNLRRVGLVSLAAATFLISTGCETADPKPAKTNPPAAAMAPTIHAPVAATPAEAPKAPRQTQPVPQQDPVPALIEKAEREYQTGQTNYATGHLEAAKVNFDRAVDMLMQGPVDIKSDDRLQREFDKIVEGVHNLEMAALKVGDGFSYSFGSSMNVIRAIARVGVVCVHSIFGSAKRTNSR